MSLHHTEPLTDLPEYTFQHISKLKMWLNGFISGRQLVRCKSPTSDTEKNAEMQRTVHAKILAWNGGHFAPLSERHVGEVAEVVLVSTS